MSAIVVIITEYIHKHQSINISQTVINLGQRYVCNGASDISSPKQ